MNSELDEIRARRMSELQQQMKGVAAGDGHEKGNSAEAERRAAAEDMKNSILSQVLTQSARARLSVLSTAKPDKGDMVEKIIVQMAQTGQIVSKLNEEELIGLMQKVNHQFPSKHNTTTVKFDRRRAALDSDEDL